MAKKGLPSMIVFIRHGKSLRNEHCPWPYLPDDEKIIALFKGVADRDTPLSEEGAVQAEKTGHNIRSFLGIPDIIFHSGYLRTVQTMNGIINALSFEEKSQMKILQEFSIRERAVGYAYDLPQSEARKLFPWVKNYHRMYSDFNFCPPGGESLVQVVDRVRLFVNSLLTDFAGKKIFIISHARAIQCMMYLLEGQNYNLAFKRPEGNLKNCSITVYEKDIKQKRMFLKKCNVILYK